MRTFDCFFDNFQKKKDKKTFHEWDDDPKNKKNDLKLEVFLSSEGEIYE